MNKKITYVTDLQDGDEIVCVQSMPGCFTVGKTYKVSMTANGPCIRCDSDQHVDNIHASHAILPQHLERFERFIQQKGGWIGVDLDGTLAVYDRWRGPYHIGEPIMPMVERVRRWLAEGRTVRIFTARVTDLPLNEDGTVHDLDKVRLSIVAWCLKHIGSELQITNVKDWHMMELWDDRAVQVRPNTGVTLADELEAIQSADAGKVATP